MNTDIIQIIYFANIHSHVAYGIALYELTLKKFRLIIEAPKTGKSDKSKTTIYL
jgi:hypothetical protein